MHLHMTKALALIALGCWTITKCITKFQILKVKSFKCSKVWVLAVVALDFGTILQSVVSQANLWALVAIA